jgi:hypothetical protein
MLAVHDLTLPVVIADVLGRTAGNIVFADVVVKPFRTVLA